MSCALSRIRYMRILLAAALLAASLSAQAPRVQGHAFFGLDNPPSGDFNYNSAGVGADIFVYRGLAVSPAGGYVFSRENGLRGAGVFNLNGSYHFLRGQSRFEPFVSAGYGAISSFSDGVSAFTYGGGGQYWFTKRAGLRVELMQFQSGSYRELTSIRFGFSFR